MVDKHLTSVREYITHQSTFTHMFTRTYSCCLSLHARTTKIGIKYQLNPIVAQYALGRDHEHLMSFFNVLYFGHSMYKISRWARAYGI